MTNYDFGPASGPRPYNPDDDNRHSTLSLVLLIVGVVVAAALGLTLVFWALGALFSVLALALRVALIVGIAAFVWRRVSRGRYRKYDY